MTSCGFSTRPIALRAMKLSKKTARFAADAVGIRFFSRAYVAINVLRHCRVKQMKRPPFAINAPKIPALGTTDVRRRCIREQQRSLFLR